MFFYYLLGLIHNAFVTFIAIGFILPTNYLIIYLCCWPLIYLHWHFNDDKCILTQIEDRMRGKNYTHNVYISNMRRLQKYGIEISYNESRALILCGTSIIWLIAFYRYVF